MEQQRHFRADEKFTGNFNNRELRILIIGAGAGGSYLAYMLSKEGYSNITVYDADIVDPTNIGTQIFGNKHLGQPKVTALAEAVVEAGGMPITARNEWFDPQNPIHMSEVSISRFVICAVDTMKFRKEFYETILKTWNFGGVYVDMRASQYWGDTYSIDYGASVDGIQVEYESRMYSDEEAVNTPCSHKSVPHLTMMQAALTAGIINNKCNNMYWAPPFHWSLDMKSLMWDINHIGVLMSLPTEIDPTSPKLQWLADMKDSDEEEEEEENEDYEEDEEGDEARPFDEDGEERDPDEDEDEG